MKRGKIQRILIYFSINYYQSVPIQYQVQNILYISFVQKFSWASAQPLHFAIFTIVCHYRFVFCIAIILHGRRPAAPAAHINSYFLSTTALTHSAYSSPLSSSSSILSKYCRAAAHRGWAWEEDLSLLLLLLGYHIFHF